MNKLNIGINGFGRIGRNASRIIQSFPDLNLSAINSHSTPESHAYLLKHDSSYGTLPNVITSSKDSISIDGRRVKVLNFNKPDQIPWNEAGVDIVIDATGKFRTKQDLSGHLKSKVQFVVLSAPAKDDMPTFVYGVNNDKLDTVMNKIFSNSSCTTNCMATCLKVLEDNLGVANGFMTTIHSVTDSQNILDNSHKKEVRLRRAAFLSMIPASTGSAGDISKLYPNLEGKISCQSIRVPLATVSLIILSLCLKKPTTANEINNFYKNAAATHLKGILSVSDNELVSSDYKGSSYSSIVDTFLTKVVDGKNVTVYAWYDNEWGYSSRLIDMVRYIAKSAHLL